MAYRPSVRTVTIASGATISDAAQIEGATLIGLILPAEFDGTTLTFQVSQDNATFVPLSKDTDGAAYSLAAGASKAYSLDPALFLPWAYVKLVAGTAQTGASVVTLLVRPVA